MKAPEHEVRGHEVAEVVQSEDDDQHDDAEDDEHHGVGDGRECPSIVARESIFDIVIFLDFAFALKHQFTLGNVEYPERVPDNASKSDPGDREAANGPYVRPEKVSKDEGEGPPADRSLHEVVDLYR